jgi:hypothetical protein
LYIRLKDRKITADPTLVTKYYGEILGITGKYVYVAEPTTNTGPQFDITKNTQLPINKIKINDCVSVLGVNGWGSYAIKVDFQ